MLQIEINKTSSGLMMFRERLLPMILPCLQQPDTRPFTLLFALILQKAGEIYSAKKQEVTLKRFKWFGWEKRLTKEHIEWVDHFSGSITTALQSSHDAIVNGSKFNKIFQKHSGLSLAV